MSRPSSARGRASPESPAQRLRRVVPLDSAQVLTLTGRGPRTSGAWRRGLRPRAREGANVPRPARRRASRSACRRHGAIGRNRHLSRARGAQQPAGASPPRDRPQAARPLCRPHGEPHPLRRVLRGGRAIGPLLHQRQFVPDGGRSRLYRQQQPLQGADHVAGEARRRARGDGRLSQCRTLPDRRRTRPRRPRAQPRRSDGALSRNADRRRVARHGDALFLRNDGQAQGGLEAASAPAAGAAAADPRRLLQTLEVPRGTDLSLPGAALSRGALGRGRRDDPPRRDGHRHGALRRGAFPSSSSRRIASPTPSLCRRCSRAC